jgi:hypothetical protein
MPALAAAAFWPSRPPPAAARHHLSDAEIALGSTAGSQGVWLNILEKAFGEIVVSRERYDEPAVDAFTRTGTTTQAIALLTGHEVYWFPFRSRTTPVGLLRDQLDALLPEVRTTLRATDRRRWLTSRETTRATPLPEWSPTTRMTCWDSTATARSSMWDRSGVQSHFRSGRQSHLHRASEVRRAQRVQPNRSARLQSARSHVKPRICRNGVRRGRAGQAFELGEPVRDDRVTANSLAANRRGPPEDNQAVKTKLPSVFPKPQFRDRHERPGFPSANDHFGRPPGRASR